MSLDPKAVALQGLGFLSRLVALQGLWPEQDTPQPDLTLTSVPWAHYESRKRDSDDDVLLFLI